MDFRKELMNVTEVHSDRSWDSTCRDCIHLKDGFCGIRQARIKEDDCIATVCRSYQSREKTENKITNRA